MKTEQIIRGATAGLLTLSVLAVSGHALAARSDADGAARYGSRASGSPSRTIVIDNGTRHINVTRLETAALRVSGENTTWTFDTVGTRSFPLSRIIPDAEGVTVYVEESPLYVGN